jgi:N-ethylmaleimide reductase
VSPAGGIVPSGDEQSQFNHVVEALDGLGIAYIHVVEGATGGPRNATPFDFDALRQRFRKTYIANNGYDLELAMSRLSEGKADLFAFGHHFIANPDLVERLKSGKPLAQMNPATIYGGGAEGYTDYPAVSG